MTAREIDVGQLSRSEAALAAERFPERLAMAENDQPILSPDVLAELEEMDRRLGNGGARLADDCFCSFCGRRGVNGPTCPTCERSDR